MKGLIYKIVYKIDGRIYVGQTKNTLEDRVNDHFYKKSYSTPFDKFCHTHNISDFEIETIEIIEAESQKELKYLMDEKEIYWIKTYNSFSPTLETGFNRTKGGGGNSGLKGENSVNYGRRHSPEVNAKKGRKGEESHWFGKHHTEESKNKMSIAAQGRKSPMLGKHHTTESKEKIKQKAKGRAAWNKGLKRIYDEKLHKYTYVTI